uniref:Uncharacterized protein n=1 Tax=viral metagenome TaxID=1070528 RepID=A0A6C0LZJ2_9ZZZZ
MAVCWDVVGNPTCKYNFTRNQKLAVFQPSIDDRDNSPVTPPRFSNRTDGDIDYHAEVWGDFVSQNLSCPGEDWNQSSANSGCPAGYSGESGSTINTRSVGGAGLVLCSRSVCTKDITLHKDPGIQNCCMNVPFDKASIDGGCYIDPAHPDLQWYQDYSHPTTPCNKVYENYCSNPDNILNQDPKSLCALWCNSSVVNRGTCDAILQSACVGDTMLTNKACEVFCEREGDDAKTNANVNCDLARIDACTNLGAAGAIASGTKCGCYLYGLKDANGHTIYQNLFQDLQDRLNGIPASFKPECFYRDCVTAPPGYRSAGIKNAKCPNLCIQSVTINNDGTINGNVVIDQKMSGCAGVSVKKCVNGKVPSADGSQCVDPGDVKPAKLTCPSNMIPTSDGTGCIKPDSPQNVICPTGWKVNDTKTGCIKIPTACPKGQVMNKDGVCVSDSSKRVEIAIAIVALIAVAVAIAMAMARKK